jgi:hypothetical protein
MHRQRSHLQRWVIVVVARSSVGCRHSNGQERKSLERNGYLTTTTSTTIQRERSVGAGLGLASEHPLGAAIVAAARERQIKLAPPMDFESLTGKGIRGTVQGVQGLVGQSPVLRRFGHGGGRSRCGGNLAKKRRGADYHAHR